MELTVGEVLATMNKDQLRLCIGLSKAKYKEFLEITLKYKIKQEIKNER